jgi:hypothetical protein
MARNLLVAACCALALVPAAGAATASQSTVLFSHPASTPRITTTPPFVQAPGHRQLTARNAYALFLRDPKVRAWLSRYPTKGRTHEVTFDKEQSSWDVGIWWKAAGEIAKGRVDDQSGAVLEAWTGPQVAWGMARGNRQAIFGGSYINKFWVVLALCAGFLGGLVDFRRPLSWRNLDLLALVGFSASLWYFNQGHVLTSVPLVYPPLVYLLARALWIGIRGRGSPGRAVFPAALLLCAAVFLAGFRVGLVIWNGNVIDVGYSGVIGAERISHGQSPYGNFPVEELANGKKLKPCGAADANGEIRDRVQTNGRCESANPQGDTYGPVAYEAYLPGYWIRGWSGKWDSLPAVRLTTIIWDLLCAAGLFFVGLRFGGLELGSSLAFAWTAYPFTLWAADANTNDMLPAAFLIWGFWLASSAFGRGLLGALAGWTKFVALIVAPLWLTYPDRRPKPRYVAGFAVATVAAFVLLFLDPHPLHAARVFWDHTVSWQLGRASPFSLWDWRQYHASGLPDLHRVQNVLQALLVAAALVLPFWPRRKSPLQLAALTAALLIGFELVLTHWYYGYIDWFFAFSAFATLAPRALPEPQPVLAPAPAEPVAAA